MPKREEVAWRPDIMYRQNSQDVMNEEGKDLWILYEISKWIDINTLTKSKYYIVTNVHIILQTNRLRREGNTKLQCLLVFPLYFSIS